MQSPCGRNRLGIMRKKMEGVGEILGLNHGKYLGDTGGFISGYCAINCGAGWMKVEERPVWTLAIMVGSKVSMVEVRSDWIKGIFRQWWKEE